MINVLTKSIVGLFCVFLLSACTQNDSHLPSILSLPGAAAGSVFENARHKAKRKKVAAYVTQHYLEMRQDVSKGGGKALEGAFDVAGIKGAKRSKARERFLSSQQHTFRNSRLVTNNVITVFTALYVKSGSPESKKINGFSYSEAREIIHDFSQNNFESLRIAVQKGQGIGLQQLVSRLKITDQEKNNLFKKKAQALYYKIYLEPVIMTIMVST